jgi:AsmA protein
MNRFLKSKWFKFGLAPAAFLLFVLIVFPFFFQEKLKAELEKALKGQVSSELRFDDVHLTFFRHFPSLTLSVDNLFLGGSPPFAGDTLLHANELGFGVGISSLFSDRVKINQIYLERATIKILRDIRGNSNFDVFPPSQPDSIPGDSSAFEFEIENFSLKGSRLLYVDTSLDLVCEANNLDYRGSGNLVDGQLNLQSNVLIGEFQLVYDELPIFNRNRLSADLVTRINTETTALTFERNALKINDLPLNFVGAFEFIPGGYDMNFILESFDAELRDMLSLVPPEFMPGFEETKFGGKGDIVGSFQGFYLPEKNQFPGLVLNLRLHDGMIARTATSPGVEGLTARINLQIPELDPSQLIFDMDSLGFDLGDGFLTGELHLQGLNPMRIDSDLQAKLDLAHLHAALGTEVLDYRGQLDLLFHAQGNYRFEADPTSLRDQKPIIRTIPVFDFSAKLEKGYLHWTELPEPIKDLTIEVAANSPDSLPNHVNLEVSRLHFQVLDQITGGFFKYFGRENQRIDANLSSSFDLKDIPKFYPLDSGFQLAGQLRLELLAQGHYLPAEKISPVVNTTLTLDDGYIQSPYFPEPIQDITCSLAVANPTNSFADLEFDIQALSFTLAESPFVLKANIKNLEDIQYDIETQGRLELGKLSQVFGMEGSQVDGYLLADLSLKGKQSDAAAGRISQLDNRGSLEIEKIQIRTDLLPKPIRLEKGSLNFTQDKIEFQDFLFGYSDNEFVASGQFTNYLGYLADDKETLRGSMALKTSYVDLNDFMFFGEAEPLKNDTLGVVTGVIVPPSNLDLKVSASADSVRFGDYQVSEFTGELSTSPREILLNETSFSIVGARVAMQGAYRATSPFSADFEYEIDARDFDIQRAYQEVPIFREMVSFAEYAEGKASLEYQLGGRLSADMYPILSSIKGEGSLGLKDIKLKGFKLMNTVAEKTESEELNDPTLNDIEIKSTIANNLITIPRTKMRIAGFRPRLEGQVSLDGDLNIGMRLGLPPLGVFGIPVKITGNAENYEIKVGKSTKEDNLDAEFDEQAPSPQPNPNVQNE